MNETGRPTSGEWHNDAAVELFNRCVDTRRAVVIGLTGARYCGKSAFATRRRPFARRPAGRGRSRLRRR